MSRCAAIVAAVASTFCIGAVATGILVGGYRINMTPSEPLGLWRIDELHRPLKVGDLVFVCLPAMARFEEARSRGYLHAGLCPGGVAPLIKSVAATAGQRVEITDHVTIDGIILPGSGVREQDGEGRPLRPDPGGFVPPKTLFLHSSFASSYDSRYFGPVPESGVLGLALPVLTFDP